MSGYAIVGREAAKTVVACLRNFNMSEVPVFISDKGQGVGALEEIARVPVDVLILDINTGPGLGPAILRYRLARPQTRVILLAPGRVPGDTEVARIVQAGVYDVVTNLDNLENILEQPQAGLAAAALWLDPALAPGSVTGERVRERVVERRVAVSQRPVLIAVAGIASGVGTTTVACTLAGYLARQRYKTVLVEAGELQSLAVITEIQLDQQPVQWVPNLDVCIETNPRNLVRARQHAYVVVDLGTCPCTELVQLDADLVLVVLPQSHRILRAVTWLQAGKPQSGGLDGIRYVVTGEKKTGENMASSWKRICAELIADRDYPVAVNLLPIDSGVQEWPPGYQHSNVGLEQACRELLSEVLPDDPGKTLWSWLPFGRKKVSSIGED